MDYFLGPIKKYAEFQGRAGRQEYWMFFLFYMIFYIALALIVNVIGLQFLVALYALGLLIPNIAIATRRLHDIGKSGWWQLIALVPFVGAIIIIVLLAQDSHEDNEYGPNPKKAV